MTTGMIRLAVPQIDPAGLAGWDQRATVTEFAGRTMGTTWRVLFAEPAHLDRDHLQHAIDARLAALVAEMSHWEADSLLARFNKARADSWHALPPDFATVIAAALDIAARSDGAFDPAIGALVDLWGYGAVPPGDLRDLGLARARSGWRHLAFDRAARRLHQPGGIRLDLSGIAKGHAVDCLSALLLAHDIRHHLVEIGGEFAGRGMRPDGDPWWVELETPGGVAAPMRVALHQLAVATSGDYVRGHHTIDPRTGRPVEHALAVSVVHASAMLADAWATALSVSGDMRALVEVNGLAVRALIRDGAAVREWISPALGAMLAD